MGSPSNNTAPSLRRHRRLLLSTIAGGGKREYSSFKKQQDNEGSNNDEIDANLVWKEMLTDIDDFMARVADLNNDYAIDVKQGGSFQHETASTDRLS